MEEKVDSKPVSGSHKSPDQADVVARTASTDDEADIGLGRDAGTDTARDGRDGGDGGDGGDGKTSRWPRFYRRFRLPVHLVIWLFWTAWWVHGLVRHRHDGLGWLKATLLYLAITLRIVFLWLPIASVMRPVQRVWDLTAVKAYEMVPAKARRPMAAAAVAAVFLIGAFVPAETTDNSRASRAQSLLGLVVMLLLLWATSRDRSRIAWHTVIGGMLAQFVIALFVLRTQAGYDIFRFLSELAQTLLQFSAEGLTFLTDNSVPKLPWFFTGVIPPIIFFIALVSLLLHVGLLQWFIVKFSVFFFWSLRVSGAEAIVAAATPFIGQGESAMLIRPFIAHLTCAELHQIMTCGFATIAGSVLASYIGMGLDPQALVSSCVMSIPASLAISKMRYPETEESLTAGRVVMPDGDEHRASNSLHAFANGAWLGLKIAGMILSSLLCIIALVGLINGLLGWWGKYYNITDPPLTLQLILGYLFYPLAWLLGVPGQDLAAVGELIGIKVVINEFVAFKALSEKTELTPRARIIATYACCGFGNIGALGNQVGVLSQLAPGRAADVSRVAVSALIAGIVATLSSATVAGMLFTESVGR